MHSTSLMGQSFGYHVVITDVSPVRYAVIQFLMTDFVSMMYAGRKMQAENTVSTIILTLGLNLV